MRFRMKGYALERETLCISRLDDMIAIQYISWRGAGVSEMGARGRGVAAHYYLSKFKKSVSLGKKSIHLTQKVW